MAVLRSLPLLKISFPNHTFPLFFGYRTLGLDRIKECSYFFSLYSFYCLVFLSVRANFCRSHSSFESLKYLPSNHAGMYLLWVCICLNKRICKWLFCLFLFICWEQGRSSVCGCVFYGALFFYYPLPTVAKMLSQLCRQMHVNKKREWNKEKERDW